YTDPNAFNALGNPALTQAVRDQSWKVFDALRAAPDVRIDEPNARDETALMYLCILGQTDRARALIAAGAQVNRLGWTPLHYAASKAQVETARMLIEHGAIINAPGPDGTTPLMMAALSGKPEMVRLLLSKGADPTMFNAAHETAADWARKRNHQSLAAALDEVAGRRARMRRGETDTPSASAPAAPAAAAPAAETKEGAEDQSSFSRYFDLGRFEDPLQVHQQPPSDRRLARRRQRLDLDIVRPDIGCARCVGRGFQARHFQCRASGVQAPVPDPTVEQVHVSQETVDESRFRSVVHRLRGTLLFDPALVHDHDLVGDFQRLFLVVRDEQAGHVQFIMQAAQPAPQFLAHLGIQRAERFVEQQHARFHRQGASQRNPLALATRQGGRTAVGQPVQLHQFQQPHDFFADPALVRPLGARLHPQAESDVLEYRHVLEERIVLEYERSEERRVGKEGRSRWSPSH